ncbi:hypothetical protein [Pseudodesulfovibrio tunisiensis]|uniref:hypothetical protein n=1 Tax=Pseudodesulfovibrio tunisiensis TaxID=463192 RepID=UPI001FB4745B|nr:hypothetical protein [Pseudodesulfovibrio tunisiensis]
MSEKWTYSLALLLTAGLLLSGVVPMAGSARATEQHPAETDHVPEEPPSPGETQGDALEAYRKTLSDKVIASAEWLDSFFDDERYRETTNKTCLRIRLSPTLTRSQLRLDSYVDLRLLLPNTEKWLLHAGGDPDSEQLYGSSSLDEAERDASGRDERNGFLGLENFLADTRTRNVGWGGGVSFRNSGVVPYASLAWRELVEFDHWDLRIMQRFRGYADTGVESRTTVDYEWPIDRRHFLRVTGGALFKVDDPAQNYDLNVSLYRPLTTRRAVNIKLSNGFRDAPGKPLYLESTRLDVEYRREWREWFHVSIIPQVAMYESRDFEPEPGIRLDFNMRFGFMEKESFTTPFDEKRKRRELKTQEDREKALKEAHEKFMQRNSGQGPD